MKQHLALSAFILCASCAAPGYVFDLRSLTPRTAEEPYPPNPPRLAQAQPPRAPCNVALRDKLAEQLKALRRQEDRLSDAALRDQPPGSFARFTEMGRQDRDLQDRIDAACPDGSITAPSPE